MQTQTVIQLLCGTSPANTVNFLAFYYINKQTSTKNQP